MQGRVPLASSSLLDLWSLWSLLCCELTGERKREHQSGIEGGGELGDRV